jgi:hypothetical protein
MSIWTNPRICCEEGTFFFKMAYEGIPLWSAQWLVVGYADPAPIAAAKLASWLPLEWVPWVFQSVGVLCQILPGVWIIRNRSELFDDPRVRALAILSIALAVPIDLFWCTAFMGKFYLAIGPVLVMLEGGRSQMKLGRALLMAASPILSVQTIFFAPLALWLALFSKHRHLRRLCCFFLVGVIAAAGLVAIGGSVKGLHTDHYAVQERIEIPGVLSTSSVVATSILGP